MSRVCANPLVKEMNKLEMRCHSPLEATVKALTEAVVALMILAVQNRDLDLSISMAVKQ